MADREHGDHRRYGEASFDRPGARPTDDRSRDRGGERRSWGDDQGSGYNRDLYRGDNETGPRNDDRRRQGEPTYAGGVSEGSRRSQFRQDQRYEDTGHGLGRGGDDHRTNQRYQDDYGMGRRDYSRFETSERSDERRERDHGADWSLQSGQRGGLGAGIGSSGQGGYGAGGFGQGGYGQSGYGGDYGQRQQGQDQGGHNYSRGQAGGYVGGQGLSRQQQQLEAQHGGHAGADHDLDPDYRSWRDQRLADYDRDYSHWREHQARRHDDEYRSWRDQRRGQFHSEFETWRSSRSAEQTDRSGEPSDSLGQGGGSAGELPEDARPGAFSRQTTWSAGAGSGTGQGPNEGGGGMAQGLPNGGIAPGGGHYGEEYPTSGVTTAGGWSAAGDARPGQVSTGGTGNGGASAAYSSSASSSGASGPDAAVGANTALHNIAQGKTGSTDKSEDARNEDTAKDADKTDH